ncbi:hypothetical protein SAMN04487934_10322, partial [Eubacterium ruminantium]
ARPNGPMPNGPQGAPNGFMPQGGPRPNGPMGGPQGAPNGFMPQGGPRPNGSMPNGPMNGPQGAPNGSMPNGPQGEQNKFAHQSGPGPKGPMAMNGPIPNFQPRPDGNSTGTLQGPAVNEPAVKEGASEESKVKVVKVAGLVTMIMAAAGLIAVGVLLAINLFFSDYAKNYKGAADKGITAVTAEQEQTDSSSESESDGQDDADSTKEDK